MDNHLVRIITHSAISGEYIKDDGHFHLITNSLQMKDYSSLLFHKLRNLCKLDTSTYLSSVNVDNKMISVTGTGKGATILYRTHDRKIFIKNLAKSESKLLQSDWIREYYSYLERNQHSLLIRLFGHCKIDNVRFLVMEDLFSKSQTAIYDLKGSTIGRQSNGSEKESGQFKDNDLDRKFAIVNASDLITQIKQDVSFLESKGIMDYSLLIGVSDCSHENFRCVPSIDRMEYFTFAIIDYLTKWNLRKMAAQTFKGITSEKSQLSTIAPDQYASRFIKMMETIII